MKKSYLKYITSLLLFGSNGIVASFILLNSIEIVFTRIMIGSLFLILIFVVTKQKPRFLENKVHFRYLTISGVAMGASWLFLFEAYAQIGVSIATLAYYCGPVIIIALSPILFKEKMNWKTAVSLLTVLIGMFCVNNQVVSEGGTAFGLFCGIMAAVMYAVMVILNKKATSITGLENSMLQLCTGFLAVTIFMGFFQGYPIRLEPDSILPILVLGVINTGVGCYFYFSSIGNLPVQTLAILGYLEPLSALVFSSVFLRETLQPIQIVGAVFILGGAAFGELSRQKAQAGRKDQVNNLS